MARFDRPRLALASVARWFDSSTERDPVAGDRIDWLRTLPFIAVHLACLAVIWVGVSRLALEVAGGLYVVRMFAITGFYHRYFAHRTFRTSRAVQFIFACIGASSVQRGPLWWAAHHRNHHINADTPADPHSPQLQGFVWSHMGWFLTSNGFRTDWKRIPDLARYPELRWLDRFDVLVPVRTGHRPVSRSRGRPAELLVWGFFISTVVLFHATVTINSLAHRFGSRRFETRDDSRNNLWLALLTFGEGWHNNHHFCPGSVRQGFRWWEVDLTYYGLRLLQLLGLVHALKPVPSHVMLKARALMRIAVIGSGISGLASAWLLARQHEVTLFEANDYLGGHTHTHRIEVAGQPLAVDTGFIVFNEQHYPLLTRLFAELGVASQPTTMSFSVHSAASGLEYSATSLDTLFCQRRNLLSRRFWGMLRDLRRFYRESPALLAGAGPGPTLGEYLAAHDYGAAFRDEHLVPMAAALWSAPASRILQFPAQYLVRFMANHQMLQLRGRAPWRVVCGGSASYVAALRARWHVTERLNCPVRSVRREAGGVHVASRAGTERFDQVVLACHSDECLRLLADPSAQEREVLGAMTYQDNEVVLHTDAALMPPNRKAWAAWNAFIPERPQDACTVSYCMNLLQGLATPKPLIVTLNRTAAIDPARVLRRMHYRHPVYTRQSVAAQARRQEIQGVRGTWFAGAYWGWGFHEDGLRSAVQVHAALTGRVLGAAA